MCTPMVLTKVGGAKMKPIFRGTFIGMKEDIRMIQGKGLFVSGCTAAPHTSSARYKASLSATVIDILYDPVFSNYAYSLAFYS